VRIFLVIDMRILVGCEYSGVVRDAFRDAGHTAFSCDLIETESRPHVHYQMDVFEAIDKMDKLGGWDLIILHPECTKICVSGNRWYGKGMPRHSERLKAVAWTEALWEYAIERCARVCMENPVGVLKLPFTQFIQPYEYGHPETKKTGLRLHGLPKLTPTNNVKEEMDKLPDRLKHRIHHMSPGKDRGKERARFFTGWAEAMAEQWGT